MALSSSISYFVPALPKRPIDRCSRNDCYCHFLPTEFDHAAAAILRGPVRNIAVRTTSSHALVETELSVASGKGALLFVINWRNEPVANLTITVNEATDLHGTPTLASTGEELPVVRQVGGGEQDRCKRLFS